MPLPEPTSPDTSSTKLKVFLSYSRKDAAFAQELLTALELLGFDAYLDKEDIAPGEPWEDRLGALIQMADTVVFVISPHSLASKHCTWEVEETARMAKRLVPVMLRQDQAIEVPERLRKLNYVFFSEGQSFSKGLGDLARALRADIGWIREHTRYGDLARRWIERKKAEALLLRGSDLDDARRWAAERPNDAPEISVGHMALIEASGKAAEAELAAKAKLRWRVQAGLAAASVVLAGLAAFSGVQWQAAETAKVSLADNNVKLEATVGDLKSAQVTLKSQNEQLGAQKSQLEAQKSQLEASNAKLSRRLALRVGALGNDAYEVPPGWFQVATAYAGAVGFIEKRSAPGQFIASGAIVSGRLLDPRWTDQPVLVTATYVVTATGGDSPPLKPEHATLVVTRPTGERQPIRLGKVLWQSDGLGISVSSFADALPADTQVIDRLVDAPRAIKDLPGLSRDQIDAMFDGEGLLRDGKGRRPIIFFGNLEGRADVALSIGHLLGALSTPVQAESFPNIARATVPVPTSISLHADLVYLNVTLPGSGGSPIFDAETGDLLGIHMIRHPCPAQVAGGRRCAGGGTSISRIVAAIRAEPAGR